MKRTWNYNLLQNIRIKNILFTLIIFSSTSFFVYRFFENTKNNIDTNFLLLGTLYLLVPMLFSFSPLRQVLERINKSEFVTYYFIGWLKFNSKIYSIKHDDAVVIRQDIEKYYCLTIKTQNAGDIIIERYPTLDLTKIRERELQEILN